MSPIEHRSLLTICLLAAFADELKDEREREEIKRIASTLSAPNEPPQLASVYQEVLTKRIDLAEVAQRLTDPSLRQLAYELAVCVCDADGASNDAERRFLQSLKSTLGLPAEAATRIEDEAGAVAEAPLSAIDASLSPAMAASTSLSSTAPAQLETELDREILNASILNGALELLPQTLASMAVISLQIKLVYRIGKAYGHDLDRGHIREFIATAGIGAASQYIEQIGRKLLGGLLGGIAGGLGRSIGRASTGVAFSFASTYALGHLAKRYYAGGRQMTPALVRETYEALLERAKRLQDQYSKDIQQKARSLDVSQIVSLVRGPA